MKTETKLQILFILILIGSSNCITQFWKEVCQTSVGIQAPYKSFIYWDKEKQIVEQDKTPLLQHFHLQKLPSQLQTHLCRMFDIDARHIRDVEEILRSAARYPELSDILHQSVIQIVKESSRSQSLKGILTAGPWTSIKYSYRKVGKMLRSLYSRKIVK